MITKAITKAFDIARKRGWDRIYWAIDLHDTVLKSTHTVENAKEFYPDAIETLQLLTARKDVVLVMYTSSHNHDIVEYNKLFAANGITFEHVNTNPHVLNTEYADFSMKMYFNVLVDDKAGFDAETDWKHISIAVLGQSVLTCI